MPPDRSFTEHNRAATERIRGLAARLTDDDLRRPIGQYWTIATALAHLPFWAAIPPRQAAQLAMESADALDRRLADMPAARLEKIYGAMPRWVLRHLHRTSHLDEIDGVGG